MGSVNIHIDQLTNKKGHLEKGDLLDLLGNKVSNTSTITKK